MRGAGRYHYSVGNRDEQRVQLPGKYVQAMEQLDFTLGQEILRGGRTIESVRGPERSGQELSRE